MEHEIPLVFARSKRLRVEYIKYVQSQVDKILSNHALRLDKFITCILNQGNLIDQNFCDCDKKKSLLFSRRSGFSIVFVSSMIKINK